jgi:hypothetical protein
MYTYFKANLLAIYALTMASWFIPLPWGSGPYLQKITLILFVIHALETTVAFKHVKSYKGPLLHSIGLSMLFGLLHWLPLARVDKAKGGIDQ